MGKLSRLQREVILLHNFLVHICCLREIETILKCIAKLKTLQLNGIKKMEFQGKGNYEYSGQV